MSYHTGGRSNRQPSSTPSNRRRGSSSAPSGRNRGGSSAAQRARARAGTGSNERVMRTLRKNRGGSLTITNTEQSVDPPKGYHWMLENGRYFLMKGDYKPHDKAVRRAKFKIATHG